MRRHVKIKYDVRVRLRVPIAWRTLAACAHLPRGWG
jgi:hypothetical protein